MTVRSAPRQLSFKPNHSALEHEKPRLYESGGGGGSARTGALRSLYFQIDGFSHINMYPEVIGLSVITQLL